MNRKWLLPLIVLLILLALYWLRYERVWQYDPFVAQWATDRWTGFTWHMEYGRRGVERYFEIGTKDAPQVAYYIHYGLTGIWIIAFSVAVVKLVKSVKSEIRDSNKLLTNSRQTL